MIQHMSNCTLEVPNHMQIHGEYSSGRKGEDPRLLGRAARESKVELLYYEVRAMNHINRRRWSARGGENDRRQDVIINVPLLDTRYSYYLYFGPQAWMPDTSCNMGHVGDTFEPSGFLARHIMYNNVLKLP